MTYEDQHVGVRASIYSYEGVFFHTLKDIKSNKILIVLITKTIIIVIGCIRT